MKRNQHSERKTRKDKQNKCSCCRLKALAVNHARSALIVLLLGDPHGLKGGERSQHGSSAPRLVRSLKWRRDRVDLLICQLLQFFVNALVEAGKQSATAGQLYVVVHFASQVHIAFQYRFEQHLVHTGRRDATKYKTTK